jgi:choline dehydrogenase-like flavoprotein
MQIDLSHVEPRAEPFRSQVCIIGAGLAGLTLAHKLSQCGIDIALLEAGGPSLEPRSQSLFAQARNAGAHHLGLHTGRFRAFGGSSIRWGGQVLPNSPPNRVRSSISGPSQKQETVWPIPEAGLQPFYTEAQTVLGLNSLAFEAASFSPSAPSIPGTEIRFSKWAPFSHRNLAQTIGKHLPASVTLYLHASVTELIQTNARITSAIVRNDAGIAFHFEATHFILAAGTIETSRLLLASRSQSEQGIGNFHDQVGRNFHDHLSLIAATPTGPARARLLQTLTPRVFSGTLHTPKLEATPELRDQLQLISVHAHLTIDEPEDSGIAALRDILQARQSGDLASTLRKHFLQLPASLAEAAHLAWHARLHHRRYISPRATTTLRLNVEQQLRPDSRITLSRQHDTFGMPLVILDWKISDAETQTLRRFATHLSEQLTALAPENSDDMRWNEALFDLNAPLPHLEDVFHPMGGTLMGIDPRTSVVDPNLTVHGIANLHIASASTFPTGGSPLPALPLMALSLRLADRLTTLLRN